jgi:small subunit ribosomal protein S16
MVLKRFGGPYAEVCLSIDSGKHFPYNHGLSPIFTGTRFQKMVVIRLARSGAKKRPFFNIVVTDSRNRRDGRFIERVGFYNPVASGQAQALVLDNERLAFWQSNGAQLSPTAARLVKQAAEKKAA